jgi:oligosaccharide reducing-end xylanase
MRKHAVVFTGLSVALVASLLTACRSPLAPKIGAAATGRYRNLFVEAGHSPEEAAAKINAAFQQFFHGDPTNQTVYYSADSNSNGPLAYVTDIKSRDARTEGLSYGMMIAAPLNRKAEFDALWNCSNTYLHNDNSISR